MNNLIIVACLIFGLFWGVTMINHQIDDPGVVVIHVMGWVMVVFAVYSIIRVIFEKQIDRLLLRFKKHD